MSRTLFIINPNAGRIRQVWRDLEPRVNEWVDNFRTIITHHPDDIAEILDQSTRDDVDRIVSVGGDGTNQHMVNALMLHRQNYPEHELILGTIPAGTGRDFARGMGIPLDTFEAAEYVLTQATPKQIDIGLARFGDEKRYFHNFANAGIASDVVARVEKSGKHQWSFLMSVLSSLASYRPEAVTIELDGEHWFEGNIIVAGIGNGKSTGQGILLAPDAILDDGLFDVVIGEQMPLWELVQVFPKIYAGTHIGHRRVHHQRAKHVKLISRTGKAIGMDLDGEASDGAMEIVYEVVPSAITMLL
ncbi:MAG: diacylglycerol kinase family protein [Chloroflexota bacterium]